jgi:hypothetical protein
MKGAKDKEGEKYWLQILVHGKYVNQEWHKHYARQEL